MKKIVIIVSGALSCSTAFAQTVYNPQSPQQSLSGVWTAIGLIAVALLGSIGAAAYYVYDEKQKSLNRKKSHTNRVTLEATVEGLRRQLADLEQKVNDMIYNQTGYQYDNKSYAEYDNKPYTEQFHQVKESNSSGQIQAVQPTHSHTAQKLPVVKYPKAIIQNGFRDDLSDRQGNNYFKFFDIKDNTASFEYCGIDFEKAKANKDTLEIVCEISGTSVTAHAIENEQPGSVQFKDGKWEIIKKAKIKFV